MEKTVHHVLYPKSERAMCGALNTAGLKWSSQAVNVTCSDCNEVYEAFHAGLLEMLSGESMRQSLSKSRAL